MRRNISLVLSVVCCLTGLARHVCAQKPELISQTGHSPTVIFQVAFSPDGKTLASASWDKSVRLWDVETGRELRTFFYSELFSSVAFDRSGKMLAGGSSGRVLVWSVESGELLSSLKTDGIFTNAVAFSPDGKTLAVAAGVGGDATVIELWDLTAPAPFAKLKGCTGSINRLEFTEDQKYVTCVGSETSGVWEITSRALVQALPNRIPHLVFSPDLTLMAGRKDDQITVFEWAEEKEKVKITVPRPGGLSNFITAIAFSPDNKILASGEVLGTIRLWSSATGRELRTLTGQSFYFKTVALTPDGNTIAVGDLLGRVKVWDVRRSMFLTPIQETSGILSLGFSPDGQTLATTGMGNMLKLWNFEKRTVVKIAPLSKRYLGTDEADPVGNLSALSQSKAFGVSSFTFSPDGKLIAVGGRDKNITLWEQGGRKYLRTIFFGAEPTSLALSPDGRTLVGAGEKLIKIWRLNDGRLLFSLRRNCQRNIDCVNDVIFNSDGRTIAGCLDNKTVRMWDARTGKVVRSLARNDSAAESEIRRLSPPLHQRLHKLLVTQKFMAENVSSDRVRILDKDTGQELASLTVYGENDWLVTTPEGFFDGTSNAWKQLIWRFNNNTFDYGPVELYFNDFYYPNLLQDVLAGKSPKPPVGRELGRIDRRQPEVEIVAVDGRAVERMGRTLAIQYTVDSPAAITIEVADNEDSPKQPHHPPSSGARDLRLFRNGSLVKRWRGSVFDSGGQDGCEKVAPRASGQPSLVRCRANIPVVAGENNFTAYAFNDDNVKSNDSLLSVKGADKLKRKGTLYIVSVGVNDYENAQYNLRYAVADAQEFAAELKRQQEWLQTYRRVESILLFNKDATKEQILRALADLRGRTQPEDAVILYFSGHGTAQEKRFYLIPHDLSYRGSRDALDAAGLKTILAHSISDRELEAAFEKIDAAQYLLVIDACNSGQALDAEERRRGPMNAQGLAQLAYEKGMYVLTASESYERAWENSTLGNGYLTYALVEEGVRLGLADNGPKDGRVMLREWLDYAVQRVPLMQLEGLGKELRRPLRAGLTASSPQPVSAESQTPRVFYRRELEATPLIIARP